MTQEPDGPSLRTLVRGARVRTLDPARPAGDALLISGERIEAVGREEELRADHPAPDRILDADGCTLLPGFVDAHAHLVDGGLRLAALDLRGTESPEEFREEIHRFTRGRPPGGWVVGSGWDHQRWGGSLPERGWIDAVAADRPVLLTRSDLHMAVANGRALELAGIGPDTPDPEGGRIHRDPDGHPTGVLVDRAIERVIEQLPAPTPAELDAALDRAQAHALCLGVTQLHDMGAIPPSDRDLELLERARAEGRLRMRVHVATPLTRWREAAARIAEVGRGDEWLWWGGLKGFVDGSLGAGTAWFRERWLDQPGRGLTVVELDELAADVRGADRAGLQPIVHAIGDAAVEWLIELYAGLAEVNGPAPRRPRIEHAQHLPPGAEERMAEAGIVASVQPAHLADDAPWMEERIGPERARRSYAFRSLAAAGVPLAFGSDWTVAPLDPLRAIEAAVRRCPRHRDTPWYPEERLPLEAALAAHTRGAAHAAFAEGFSGTLRPGAVADFVILDGDLFEGEAEGVGERVINRTFVGGRECFTREGC